MRVLFLAVDPLGLVAADAATVVLGTEPCPAFLAAGESWPSPPAWAGPGTAGRGPLARWARPAAGPIQTGPIQTG